MFWNSCVEIKQSCLPRSLFCLLLRGWSRNALCWCRKKDVCGCELYLSRQTNTQLVSLSLVQHKFGCKFPANSKYYSCLRSAFVTLILTSGDWLKWYQWSWQELFCYPLSKLNVRWENPYVQHTKKRLPLRVLRTEISLEASISP